MKLRRKSTGVVWSVDQKYFDEFKNDNDFEVVNEEPLKTVLKASVSSFEPKPYDSTISSDKELTDEVKPTPEPAKSVVRKQTTKRTK